MDNCQGRWDFFQTFLSSLDWGQGRMLPDPFLLYSTHSFLFCWLPVLAVPYWTSSSFSTTVSSTHTTTAPGTSPPHFFENNFPISPQLVERCLLSKSHLLLFGPNYTRRSSNSYLTSENPLRYYGINIYMEKLMYLIHPVHEQRKFLMYSIMRF